MSESNDQRHRGPDAEELLRAVPTESGGRHLRVGSFVVLGVASFIAALFLLTDPASMRGRYMLVTRMEDVGGVRRGDPVQMRGVNVGRVHGFELTRDGQVDMTLEVEGDWRVPEGSHVTLQGTGLFGGRTVGIHASRSTDYYEEWDTLPGVGAEADLFATAGQLSEQAETVLDRVARVLDEPTVGAVRKSARELEALMGELTKLTRSQQEEIAELTRTLNRAADGIETASEAGPDARRAVARADSTMATLNRTSATLEEATGSLNRIVARMEAGEGTLGKLSRDDSLYVNLNRAAISIRLFMEDLRANPERYIDFSIF